MIVGRNFVWLHFPKTGGHTVETALRAAGDQRDLAFDTAEDEGHWHESLAERMRRDPSFRPDGRVVVSGFRRLPWWMLSRVHYEAARAPFHCASRDMLCRGEFYENDGSVSRADNHALQFSGVDRWIRLENLAEDFGRQFGDLLGARVQNGVRKLRRIVNPTRVDYIKNLGFYFTAAELVELYRANPAWAAVELALYGNLLSL